MCPKKKANKGTVLQHLRKTRPLFVYVREPAMIILESDLRGMCDGSRIEYGSYLRAKAISDALASIHHVPRENKSRCYGDEGAGAHNICEDPHSFCMFGPTPASRRYTVGFTVLDPSIFFLTFQCAHILCIFLVWLACLWNDECSSPSRVS